MCRFLAKFKNIYFFAVFLAMFVSSRLVCAEPGVNSAVTYTFSGGRFGDNLMAYMHAKWVSYKYQIPLIYRHFPYAEALKMHYQETFQPNTHLYTRDVRSTQEIEASLIGNSLFVVPYFPESKHEREHHFDQHGRRFAYIPVDWEDKGFRQELKKQVAPLDTFEPVEIPHGVVSVACHLRRGGGFDGGNSFRAYLLKFPQDNFFIDEIKWLLKVFQNEHLFVYLFTDDQNPLDLKKRYEQIFQGEKITFACRTTTNHYTLHVLDDFFAMTQFDCFIHGESNYALCAAKICDYLIECVPSIGHWEGDRLIIDEVQRTVRKELLYNKFAGCTLNQEDIGDVIP